MSIQQIFFLLIVILTIRLAVKLYGRIYRNIKLGQEDELVDNDAARWKNMLLVAFGQKKMFKRWIPAVLHFFIYAAFLITQIELIEIFVDGFFGVHRFFAPYLGGFYTFIINFIEILSIGAMIATFVFLARRNLLRIPRFWKPEMKGWPFSDANIILFGELALVTGIFMMNGADVVLQKIDPAHYHDTGHLLISGFMGPLLFDGWGQGILEFVERTGWWLHIITVLLFIIYLPISKHLHVFLAFPNVFFSKLTARGKMENIPTITSEVRSMMGLTTDADGGEMTDDIPEFGACDVMGLSERNILNAYTCTECGRCTDVCPANMTGKRLSPRKIMMDVRDRADEVGRYIDDNDLSYSDIINGIEDGKNLFDNIAREEIHACTNCNACVEACPVMIDPLDIILQLRRYEILTESTGPSDWLPMFNSLESSGAVWQVTEDREAWMSKM